MQSIAGFGPSITSQTIQPELLKDIIREKESYVTLVLSQFYVTPLKLTDQTTTSILGEIVDGLIISRLLQIHYESSVSPVSGSQDMGNSYSDLRRQAELMLAAVSGSSNVFFSVQPSPIPNNYGSPEIQPLVLPGECVLTRSQRPDIITRNYSFSQNDTKTKKLKDEFGFGIENDGCGC